MKNNILIIFVTFLSCSFFLKAQNYDNLKVKEQYDLFNLQESSGWNVCASQGLCNLGDGYAQILDSYITMYKTTKDKAYLYKFWLEALCLIKSLPTITIGQNTYTAQVWCANGGDGSEYHTGHTIAALARFAYLVKVEDVSIQSIPVYPFHEITSYPYNYPQGGGWKPYDNFYYFADWISYRVDEAIDYYRAIGKLDLYNGIFFNVGNKDPEAMNKQSGFGKALLFQGYTDPNTYFYTPAAKNMAKKYSGSMCFTDLCSAKSFCESIIRENSTFEAYWWYHQGWGHQTYCGSLKQINYNHYTEFVEDMSHGAHDISFAMEYYKMQPQLIQKFVNGSPNYSSDYFDVFTHTDMIKFKNTFTKLLYDGYGQFNNAVDGSDGPITQGTKSHNEFAISSMCYMPLEEYDDGDGPSVYNIVMNYYANNIATQNTKPGSYGGFHNKGHADVVAAQWKRGCPNLELYNRKMVYDQDFFAKNNLIITPGTSNISSGESFAEPKILTKEFIVINGVTVNMTAGESIALLPGVRIESGSDFKAVIIPGACTNGQRLASDNSNGENYGSSNSDQVTSKEPVSDLVIKARAVPNPFSNSTNIQFTLNKESNVSFKIIDNFGRIAYESKNDENYKSGFNEIIIPMEGLANGLYSCLLNIDNKEIHTINLVKQ